MHSKQALTNTPLNNYFIRTPAKL